MEIARGHKGERGSARSRNRGARPLIAPKGALSHMAQRDLRYTNVCVYVSATIRSRSISETISLAKYLKRDSLARLLVLGGISFTIYL